MAEYKRKKVHTGKLRRSKPDLHKPQWDIPVFSRKKSEEPAEKKTGLSEQVAELEQFFGMPVEIE